MYRKIKYFFLLIAFVIQVKVLPAQVKTFTADSDTTFWYSYSLKKAVKLNLPNLHYNKAIKQWRLWFHGQTASYVLSLENNEGQLVFYTQEHEDPITEKPSERIYSKAYVLTKKQIVSVDSLRIITGIRHIPTDKQIKGWGDVMGLDGVTYAIEEADNSTYSFKSYWTPSSINVEEAKRLKRFIEEIEHLTNLRKLEKEFVQLIPFGSYSTGGPMVAVKVMTKKELSKLLKERKVYRRRSLKLKEPL